MSIADWIILGFLVFSVIGAASEGFFHEAFGLAGLVVGYLLAAWQYRRLADWVPDRVFRGPDGCRHGRTDRALGNEEGRSEHD